MAKSKYGRTASGIPITDGTVEEIAAKAETGYDVDKMLRRRVGRPPMGSRASNVESVRLEPELREALVQRARQDHQTTSAVIRQALREYLDAA
jgi:predicted HicB family RNase H-like nuclease